MIQAGGDRYENFMFRHMLSHPFEQQMGVLSLICGGVLERHPGLRVLIVEAGVGWVPYWLDRMDHHVEKWGFASASLPLTPTEYFQRQCFVSADSDESLLPSSWMPSGTTISASRPIIRIRTTPSRASWRS